MRTEIVPAEVELAPASGQVVVPLLVRVQYPALPESTRDASGALTVYRMPEARIRLDDEFDIRHVMELVQLKQLLEGLAEFQAPARNAEALPAAREAPVGGSDAEPGLSGKS